MRERLIVEIDGGQHNFDSHRASDAKRDARLARESFRTLRFWNSDIDQNLEGVLETIDRVLHDDGPHPTGFAGHPPPAGEG
jgi:very-short-patch-repair endonuclease